MEYSVPDTVSITIVNNVSAGSNNAPIADAGTYAPVVDTDGDGFVSITLDGSGSSDPDGDNIISYSWDTDSDGSFNDAAGQSPAVDFSVAGSPHTISLRVTDDGSPPLSGVDSATVIALPQGSYVCLAPPPTNASYCPKDTEGLTEDVAVTPLVANCSTPEGNLPKCEALCDAGYEPDLGKGVCLRSPECRDGINNDPEEDTDIDANDQGCFDSNDDDETDPGASIDASPALVVYGEPVQLEWWSKGVDSCTIDGPGVALSFNCGASGNVCSGQQEVMVLNESIYTITCSAQGDTVTDTITVRLIPRIEEL
jgi:hypothetical protein